MQNTHPKTLSRRGIVKSIASLPALGAAYAAVGEVKGSSSNKLLYSEAYLDHKGEFPHTTPVDHNDSFAPCMIGENNNSLKIADWLPAEQKNTFKNSDSLVVSKNTPMRLGTSLFGKSDRLLEAGPCTTVVTDAEYESPSVSILEGTANNLRINAAGDKTEVAPGQKVEITLPKRDVSIKPLAQITDHPSHLASEGPRPGIETTQRNSELVTVRPELSVINYGVLDVLEVSR